MHPHLALLLEAAGALLAPPRCAACDDAVAVHAVFCPGCAATVIDAGQEPACSAVFLYGGAIATAIGRFKYEGRIDLARPLAEVLKRLLPALRAFGPDLVVPVPLHAARLVERGYNQSALLAAPLATALAVAYAPRAVVRARATPQQAALARPDRLRNLQSAFGARDPDVLYEKRVLLVDDVRTTGATLAACAEAVYRAGARGVHAAVLARA